MSTVNVSIATKKQVSVSDVAGIKITLSTSAAVVDSKVVTSPYTVKFDNVPDGDYTVSAQAVNAAGDAVGDMVYDTVSVSSAQPATVTATEVDVPSSLSITVTP